MTPLNRIERTNAFLRFLLLFVITVGLIVAVVFCSFRVPFEDNKQLRQTVANLQIEKEVSDSFNVVMQGAVADLNGYIEKKERPDATSMRVQYKINAMNALLRKIPNGENSLYALMIQNLSDLNEAKKRMVQAKME